MSGCGTVAEKEGEKNRAAASAREEKRYCDVTLEMHARVFAQSLLWNIKIREILFQSVITIWNDPRRENARLAKTEDLASRKMNFPQQASPKTILHLQEFIQLFHGIWLLPVASSRDLFRAANSYVFLPSSLPPLSPFLLPNVTVFEGNDYFQLRATGKKKGKISNICQNDMERAANA